MSYPATTWSNGDVITAAKLNNIESGITANDTAIAEANTAIATKASTADMTAALATKANTSDMTTALAAKADTTAVEAALATKAEIDGSYEGMTVGNAEQLVATVGVEDKVPYQFRTSGGSADIGDREVDKLVGGTVAWNQLVTVGSDQTITQNGFNMTYNHTTGKLTIVVNNATAGTSMGIAWINLQAGHKYLISCGGMPKANGFELYFSNYTANTTLNDSYIANISSTPSGSTGLRIYCSASTPNGTYTSYPMVFDLTQMFGSTIADYIYSLETTTAGAGVAWFRKLFPKPYYAYNAGELMSVSGVASHDMTGFNQFDLSQFARDYPNFCTMDGDVLNVTADSYLFAYGCSVDILANYAGGAFCSCEIKNGTATNVRVRIVYEDDTFNETSGTGTTAGWVPNNNYMQAKRIKAIRLNWSTAGTFSIRNLCINLRWDGSRDGEYEPYSLRSYPLDSTLTLRGIPKLDANNELYYDGDTYESDGTVTRRYGIVDLGTLTWVYFDVTGHKRFGALIATNIMGKSDAINMLCTKYLRVGYSAVFNNTAEGISIHTDGNQIAVYDSAYTDAATFKTAMSGVYLVYELAEPTTESADPYQNPQVVDDFGTEEYVTDSIVPVGHETQYQANLRAKLEMAPNSPEGNGDYIVRQSNGMNVYVPITFPADELPAAPTTNGNYVLKCTVSNGTATFTWASA